MPRGNVRSICCCAIRCGPWLDDEIIASIAEVGPDVVRDHRRTVGNIWVRIRVTAEVDPEVREDWGSGAPATHDRSDRHHRGTTRGLLLGVLGNKPPEIAYWERGEWLLAGDGRPWRTDAVTVVSERLVFKPRLAPVA
jgi:hypothetical protein